MNLRYVFAFSCLTGTASLMAQEKAVSYYEDIKPVIDAYCKTCHTPGNIGPFPLTNYAETFKQRFKVAFATAEKKMPPWHVDPTHEFLYDTSLPPERIQLIQDWVNQGAPEGDPLAEGKAIFVDRGEIESVDATVGMENDYTPSITEGDEYRCFLLNWEAPEDVFLKGYLVEAGNTRIDHHMALYMVDAKDIAKVTKMEDEDDREGYECFGGPYTKGSLVPLPFVGIGGPGNNGFVFPKNTGIHIAKGSRFVMQMHYSLHGLNAQNGKVETDRTQIKLQLSREKLTPGIYFPVMNILWPFVKDSMKIPAGEPHFSHSWVGNPFSPLALLKYFFPSSLSYRKGVKIYGVSPHMHQRGKEIKMDIVRQDKSVEPIISISDWDFHWQHTFFYKEALVLGPKDKIQITCTWDNSGGKGTSHPHGQHESVQDVYWGESTEDEMCTGALFVTEP